MILASGRARGVLDGQWWLATVVVWLVVSLASAVTLPLKFPYEAQGRMLDSGVVVSLLLPVAIMGRMLDEGPATLVAGASRQLALSRLGWAALFVSGVLTLAGASMLATPVARSVFLADTLLISGLLTVGVAVLGSRLGWLVPALVLLVSSAPGLVPWRANLLYRLDNVGPLLLAGLLVLAAGLAGYTVTGSLGVVGRAGRIAAQNQPHLHDSA